MSDYDEQHGQSLRTALRAIADDGPAIGADVPAIRGAARRRRTTRAAVAAVATCAVLVAVPVAATSLRGTTTEGPAVPAPAGRASVLTVVPSDRVALFAGGDAPSTLVRSDAAAHGWSVVVRANDGGFARDGAVVTYPVEPPVGASLGAPVPVAPGVRGRTVLGGLTWPVGDGWARIRGDLPAAVLSRIAASVRIGSDRRPVVRPPDGYRVVVTTPAVPAEVTEARYAGKAFAVGGGAPVNYGGLVFTQVMLSGGLEDDIYASLALGNGSVKRTRATVPTADHPSASREAPAIEVLRTNLVGGNGDVMWEVSPGVVAVVGVSGSTPDPLDVARQSRLVDATTWQATGAQPVHQSNAFGP